MESSSGLLVPDQMSVSILDVLDFFFARDEISYNL